MRVNPGLSKSRDQSGDDAGQDCGADCEFGGVSAQSDFVQAREIQWDHDSQCRNKNRGKADAEGSACKTEDQIFRQHDAHEAPGLGAECLSYGQLVPPGQDPRHTKPGDVYAGDEHDQNAGCHQQLNGPARLPQNFGRERLNPCPGLLVCIGELECKLIENEIEVLLRCL